jgi:hypothetical protein|tara:strand:- start:601 stop:1599 length:999 start_codon:yes stop_codon:yes gene_type:complete
MRPLSQSEYGEIKDLYKSVYSPTETIEEELVYEICDELIEELITEGYSKEDAIDIVEDATNDYIDEAKVTFGSDTAPMRKSGAPVGARRRFAMRRAGDAVKKAGDAAKGAVDSAKRKASVAKAGAQIAGSIAKDEARRAGRKAALAVTTAPEKAKAAASDAKKKAKSGIKGFIKRQAQKVVSRMSEEVVDEKFSMAADPEKRAIPRPTSKAENKKGMSARSRAIKAVGTQRRQDKEVGISGQKSKRVYKEELEATGLFSEKEIAAIEEAMSSYDRNRKRAAERAAARNAARDAGKTGVVPGVGYVTPRRERETYTDEKGTVRHKSGAKMPKD